MKKFLLILAAIAIADVQAKDWWETANFYQIYPRSFIDSNNDGVGDINGIISKLEYLKELGVTATWLSPILKSPQVRIFTFYDFFTTIFYFIKVDNGYDVEDFFNVDPLFGTNEELKQMFAKAKELGIKIIMDFVPNHTSDRHQWFQDSINSVGNYTDYYVWHEGQPNPNQGRNLPPNNWVGFIDDFWSF